MSRFGKVAKENQKAGCPQMENREKVAIEDIITYYPDGITITGVGFITLEDDVAVFNFKEDESIFFFGGKVLTDLAKSWLNEIGEGDVKKMNEELQKDGGCQLKISRKKNKKNQFYTAYEVIGE